MRQDRNKQSSILLSLATILKASDSSHGSFHFQIHSIKYTTLKEKVKKEVSILDFAKKKKKIWTTNTKLTRSERSLCLLVEHSGCQFRMSQFFLYSACASLCMCFGRVAL